MKRTMTLLAAGLLAFVPGFAFATQWHPEYWVGSDAASARLFAAFGDALRAHMRMRHDALDAAE